MIGFVGAGIMGKEIIYKLSKNQKVNIYNRTFKKAKHIEENSSNVKAYKNVSSIFMKSKIVYMCVSDYDAIQNIIKKCNFCSYFKTEIIVNFSTILPEESCELSSFFNKNNIKYYDAPVSGGPESVSLGKLGCIISGPDNIVLKDVNIKSISNNINFVNGIGKAQKVKILNNLLETINMISSMEIIKLLEKDGFSFDEIQKLLSSMRGYSIYADVTLNKFKKKNIKKTSVPVYIRRKDTALSKNITQKYENMRISDYAQKLYLDLSENLDNNDDQTSIYINI
ncbi:NAD(P)-binding domain-containing protein [Staphylococcus hominis]|uniref:NAD(P)-binding domain-containing protein n=1 Tax=Staphylococcus hominis TaxID=1290 RepID=UPI00136F59C1|nr:NAD(P)-binding domain-containing protein [Staphylococcus hominis]NAM96357.1 NAD(P)-dependent oxidoreductase [Staphylococcus hominis]